MNFSAQSAHNFLSYVSQYQLPVVGATAETHAAPFVPVAKIGGASHDAEGSGEGNGESYEPLFADNERQHEEKAPEQVSGASSNFDFYA